MSIVSREQAIATGLACVRAAWVDHYGSPALEATVQCLTAQAFYESLLGRNIAGYTQIEAGTMNYGSYQATADYRQAHAHDLGYGEIAYTDSHASGQKYAAALRIYPTQHAAAGPWLAKIAECMGGWDAMLAAEPLTPELVGKALGIQPSGKICYSETPPDAYAARVAENLAVVKAVAAGGLPPENIDAVLGDDFPADAPKRVVMYAGTLPGQGGRWARAFAPKAPDPPAGGESQGSSPSPPQGGSTSSPAAGQSAGDPDDTLPPPDDPCDDSEDGTP